MTTPVKVRVSEEEYLATMTGEKPSLEFVNGEVFRKPMTKKSHNEAAMALYDALRAHRRRAGGYVTWEATTNISASDDRRYRVPNLSYWTRDADVAQPDDVYLPPTLAIEIRSEGQTLRDLRDKCREYRSRGVEACWLIDPGRRTVEVFEAGRDGETVPADGMLESAAVPGFSMAVSDLWE
jgi:Uma2 family endonuclease